MVVGVAPTSNPPSQTQLTAAYVLKDGEGVEVKVNPPEVIVVGSYVWVAVIVPLQEHSLISIAVFFSFYISVISRWYNLRGNFAVFGTSHCVWRDGQNVGRKISSCGVRARIFSGSISCAIQHFILTGTPSTSRTGRHHWCRYW